MAFEDPAKRSLLDQLTASATAQPPTAVPETATPLADAPATSTGSTANLESLASSPDAAAFSADALKQNAQEEHPGFLKTLARLAGGAVGFSSPESSPQAALGARIGSLAGRTGNALAAAAGTPEQKQLSEERNQLPLKIATLQKDADYKRAVVQNAANKTNLQYGTGENGAPEGTARMTAEAAQQNAESNEALRAAHQKQIEASLNGEVYVMPEIAHAIGRPELAGTTMSPIKYQQQVGNVVKSLGIKNQDLGDQGVWGTSPITGRITRLGDSPSVARANSMLLRTQLPVNDAQGNTLGWVNPQTKSFTAVGEINGREPSAAPLTSAVGGNVIPPKPTSSVLSRGQVAQTILPQVPVMKQEVAALADKIGPGAGRWNDFWVNKGGIDDPDYAGLNQDLQLYATALGMAHFGASMPEGFVKDMVRDFGTAQSPDDLLSRIDHAEGWIRGYAQRIGGGKGNATQNGSNPPAKKPPQKPSKGDSLGIR